jgi:hypothetical protein
VTALGRYDGAEPRELASGGCDHFVILLRHRFIVVFLLGRPRFQTPHEGFIGFGFEA